MIPNAHSLSIVNNPSRPKNEQAAHAERLGYYAQAKRNDGVYYAVSIIISLVALVLAVIALIK